MKDTTLAEFLEQVLPLLFDHTLDRLDKDLDIGHVTAYWAGPVLRVDIKPTPAAHVVSEWERTP